MALVSEIPGEELQVVAVLRKNEAVSRAHSETFAATTLVSDLFAWARDAERDGYKLTELRVIPAQPQRHERSGR